MLARASFKNFKALKALDLDLTPFTVLVGKNGSGKTSVLQGIHAVDEIAARPVTALDEPRNRAVAWFSGAFAPERLATKPGRWSIAMELTATSGDAISIKADWEEEADGYFVFARLVPENRELPRTLATDAAKHEWLEWQALKGFGSSVFLRLDPAVMVKDSVPSSEEPRLAQDGEGLASVLAYLAGADPEVLEAIRADLAKIVPQVRGIRTFPAKITRQRREVVTVGSQSMFPTFEEQVMGHRFALDMGAGRLVPSDMLSEGTVLALGLLTVLHDRSCPKLVLMDDVDAALHSTAQAELVRCLRAVQSARPEVQIICTSHSPYLLDHVDAGEVIVMALDDEGFAHARRLDQHPDSAKWRSMVRAGEFWASVGEDWVLADAG